MPLSGIDAVIFDLDGTLADTLVDLGEATNAVLEARGFKRHPLERYRQFVGEGGENLIRLAFAAAEGRDGETTRATASIETLLDEYRGEYRRLAHRHSSPYPGVPGMLDSVAAEGLKMAILSNKSDEFTQQLVQLRFAKWKFEQVRGERVGVPRKPNPQSALDIARTIGIRPENMVFLGDSGVDMHTALEAGMLAIGATWGFRGAQELKDAGARYLLDAPAGLVPLLHHVTSPT